MRISGFSKHRPDEEDKQALRFDNGPEKRESEHEG